MSASYDSDARVWDLVTKKCLHVLGEHTEKLYAVRFDGRRIVTGSLDRSVRAWDPVLGYVKSHFTVLDRTGLLLWTCLVWLNVTWMVNLILLSVCRTCQDVLSGHGSLVGVLEFTGEGLVTLVLVGGFFFGRWMIILRSGGWMHMPIL